MTAIGCGRQTLPISGTSTGNRSLEYDAQGDDYVRFLLGELLPQALAGYRVSGDPSRRAIAGISSGGHSLKHGGAILPDSLRWLWRA